MRSNLEKVRVKAQPMFNECITTFKNVFIYLNFSLYNQLSYLYVKMFFLVIVGESVCKGKIKWVSTIRFWNPDHPLYL